MEESESGERAMRKKTSTLVGVLPELQRKPRKQLTPEELEERKKKRQEAAEKRAKQTEEAQLKKEQRAKEKKAALWKQNSYVSSSVAFDSEEEEEEEDSGIDFTGEGDGDRAQSRSINYVSGDVTDPVDAKTDVNLIIHCADDSGRWGRGGLFTAIANRSSGPEQQYELAARMQDLALGDCHLISMDETEGKGDKEDWLILIIAQHRDRKKGLSGIKLGLLSNGLKKVYKLAKARKASVHLPRIGYDTPGFNWYGTERLIKKHLASRGVSTYIYYFPRKKHKQRKRMSSDDYEDQPKHRPEKKVKKVHFSDADANGDEAGGSKELPSLFEGLSFYIHTTNIEDDKLKTYKRHIIAYDGDIEAAYSDIITHVVVHPDCKAAELQSALGEDPECVVVTTNWLDKCFSKKKLVPTTDFLFTMEGD